MKSRRHRTLGIRPRQKCPRESPAPPQLVQACGADFVERESLQLVERDAPRQAGGSRVAGLAQIEKCYVDMLYALASAK
jgi:hypothetical protein